MLKRRSYILQPIMRCVCEFYGAGVGGHDTQPSPAPKAAPQAQT